MGVLGAMTYKRPAEIFPEMTEIASDPIGAFQRVSDAFMALARDCEEIKERLARLESQQSCEQQVN